MRGVVWASALSDRAAPASAVSLPGGVCEGERNGTEEAVSPPVALEAVSWAGGWAVWICSGRISLSLGLAVRAAAVSAGASSDAVSGISAAVDGVSFVVSFVFFK